MRAAVLHELKALDKLVVEEVEDPQPGPEEAVVQIHAAALNRRDVWILQGLYPGIRVPAVPGSDGCGVVTEVGNPGQKNWVGKSVVLNPSLDWGDNLRVQGKDFHILGMPTNGTFARYVKIPVANLFPKPEYLSDEQAAAIPLAGLTGYRALVTQGRASRQDTVLITGAGGGVAALTAQMAAAIGARVLVTSSSEEKLETAIRFGAEHGFNYRSEDWIDQIRDKVGGVDLIVDGAGGRQFGSMLNLLNPGGRVVVYGATAGPVEGIDIYRFFFKQITFQGSTMGSPEDFAGMIRLFEDHRIQPTVDRVFALDDIREAYQRMMTGRQMGKIVIRP
ncbi:MAG: quinone oxidoreductase family protein [Desulfobacterales bacterium]